MDKLLIILIIGIAILLFFPNNKICNKIGGIVYINLEHRIDRKKQIKKELDILGCRYIRMNAIKNENGGLGCVRSHIKCLEYAKEEKLSNIFILEDDFVFTENKKIINNKLKTIFNKLKNNWDIIMLSGHGNEEITDIDILNKITNGQTASGYIVNSHYYDTLLELYRESEKHLANGEDYNKWALDQNWKKLQEKDRWYILSPRLGKQKESYSDIEKEVVNYMV